MRALRGGGLFLAAVMVTTLVQVTVVPIASAADGPSVPQTPVPSVPVAQQGREGAPAGDETTPRALEGDQTDGVATLPGTGNFEATSLSPSATWEVSAQTGDFTWSYPIPVPPAAGGLQPNLGLSYSSSAVDGLTSATNNQASWVGDGWNLSPGFIERTYRGCADDLEGDGDEPGDLCWHTDNATMSLSGSGGQLIRDDNPANTTEKWKVKSDDGSRVERTTTAGNGDDNGESWKVTTVDGTQYFFGSSPETKSTWTVPVYGDDANEPCHNGAFADSSCVQGYRWNLDKVVDRHGNMIRYFYETEINHYGRNKNSVAAPYVRGGWLDRVDYGLRSDNAAIAASGQVKFDVVDRCVRGSECTFTKPDNLPDVPLDMKCDGGTCVDKWSPSFWTTKQLRTITTKSRVNGAYVPVDSWTLRHELPDPGDGEKPALWLKGIAHTGHTGTAIALPEVTFDGVRKPNRVHGIDGYASLIRFRMSAIITESGGATSINYAEPDCRHGSAMPADAHTNTMRCFPVKWKPQMSPERTDYFHKYVVAAVASHDGVEGTLAVETSYEYLDGAAWHWNTSEFVKDEDKTWNEFRGFGRVRIRKGSGYDGPKTMTEQRFYRGMHGDKQPSGTRQVTVSDTAGKSRTDSDWLSGTVFEQATFANEAPSGQPDPPRIEKSISEPVWHGPTATRAGFQAYIVRTGIESTYTALGAGGWRTTRTVTTYDDRWGLITVVDGQGDISTDADDLCTTTEYKPDTDKWLIDFATRIHTVSMRCGATPTFPRDAVSDVRNSYDGRAAELAPTTGNLTRLEVAAERPAAGPVYVVQAINEYDKHGRVTKAVNVLGHASTTKFTPTLGGPVTQLVSTTPGTTAVPAGLTTTTTYDPHRGVPTLTVDPNGRRTEMTYDALGRSTAVWLPNRPKASNPDPSTKFSYQIRRDGPNVVATSKINTMNTGYVTTHEVHDGLLRVRQTQTPAPGGGRLLSDTRYDSQGRAFKTTRPYFNDAPLDSELWLPTDNKVPAIEEIKFDQVGRPVEVKFLAHGEEEWSTTTEYNGDRVTVTPPHGGTKTTAINNAQGQIIELRQHKPDGFDTTAYTYDHAGALATVTDAGNNKWTYTYDLRGRKISETDPDRGESTYAYDDAGQMTSTTDARGVKLVYSYDALGRKTALHRDSVTGLRLADWTYDTVTNGKGYPAASTRYVGSSAYVNKVTAYWPMYQPARVETVIPASEGSLAGRYESFLQYWADGSLASKTYPEAGVLDAEGVSYTYNDLGMPAQSYGDFGGNVDYVTATDYTRYGELQRVELGERPKRAWLSYYFEEQTRRLSRTVVDAEVPNPMQSDVHYSYDDAGNITSIADKPQGGAFDTQCFTYDHLRRLTEAWTPAAGCAIEPSASAVGGPAPYWHSYGYDKVGNRLSEIQHGAAGATTRTYAYQGHRLNSVTTADAGGTQLDEYGYDAAGNSTSRTHVGEEQVLEWDAEGHLAKVTEDGAETSFVYDADGNRLIRREPHAVTLYLGDQEIRLDRQTKVETGTRYYTHAGQTIAVRTEAGLSWQSSNHQGTAGITIDSSTLLVARRRHLPFGDERGEPAATWPGERGFVDGTIDKSTGLTHLGAREYDPALGRFISVDPLMDLTDPQQMHGYTYSNNNPVTASDPSGMVWDYDDPRNLLPADSHNGGDGSTAPIVNDRGDGVVTAFDPVTRRNFVNGVEIGDGAPPLHELVEAMKRVRREENPYDGLDEVGIPQSDVAWDVATYTLIELACGILDGKCSMEYRAKIMARRLDPSLDPNADLSETIGVLGAVALSGLGGGRGFGGARAASRSRSACQGNSFVPGTKVLMAEGAHKPIEDIEVGDEVLATDPATSQSGSRTVVATITGNGYKQLVDLTIEASGSAGEVAGIVSATSGHPFWANDESRWIHAGGLRSGDELLAANGQRVDVLVSRDSLKPQSVYNLTVEGIHTYYVLAGNTPVLVHNCGEVWTTASRMRAAGPGDELGLPNQGRIRFVPPRGYNPANPLTRGPNNGYLDRFGNEWTVGPSRTEGHPFEWDVQLSRRGREQLGWLSRDGQHVNVDPFGEVTHR